MFPLGNISDSDDERYEANLAKKHAEAEALLREQERKEREEHQVRKQARIVEKTRLEEEAQKLAEEEQCQKQEEEQCQRDLAHRLEADCVTAIEQQWRKNWMKTFQLPSSPPSDKEMNLLDYLPLTKRQRVQYLPLTKRQRVRYLPQETLEARQRREEVAREMGVSTVSGGSPCERCADFGILCIPQNLP